MGAKKFQSPERYKLYRAVHKKAQLVRKLCLKCDEAFWSEGIGNRICQTCRKTNAYSAGFDEYEVAK